MCVYSLIPSLFPFLVLGNLIASSDLSSFASNIFSGVFKGVFHLSENLFTAYIIGLVCGYPAGCIAVCREYERGSISQKEARRAIILCTNASPAFCIGVIGGALGDMKTGIYIYLLQILSGIVTAQILPKCTLSAKNKKCIDKIPFTTAFCNAITDSVQPTFNICGFVIFFSVIAQFTGNYLSNHGFSKHAISILMSFTELSCGVNSTRFLSGFYPACISAFAVGFSGICVIMQLKAIYTEYKVFPHFFVIYKLFSGIILALLTYFVSLII